MNSIYKIANLAVLFSFLWSNIVWAGSAELYKLSAPSRVAGLAHVADAFAVGQRIVKSLTESGVRTENDFYRILREGRLEDLDGVPCLVFSDEDDETRLSYYVFNPKKSYVSRITTHPDVNDHFWQVLRGFDISSGKISFQIDKKRYYQQIFAITDRELRFINKCLDELYPGYRDKPDRSADILRKETLDTVVSLPLAEVFRYIYLNRKGFTYTECAAEIKESVELVKQAVQVFYRLGFVDIKEDRAVTAVTVRHDRYARIRDVFEKYNTADDIPDMAEKLLLILEDGKGLMEIRNEDREVWPVVRRLKAIVIFCKEVVPLIYGLGIKDSEKEELIGRMESDIDLYRVKLLYYKLQIASGEGLENMEGNKIIHDVEILWSVSPEGVEADLMEGRYGSSEIYKNVCDNKGNCYTRTGKMILDNLMGMWERNLVILGKDIETKWGISISDGWAYQYIVAPPCVHIKGEFYYKGEKIGEAGVDVDTVSASLHTCHLKILKKGHGLVTEMAGRMYLAADFVSQVFGFNTQYAHAYFTKTMNEATEEDYWTVEMSKKALEDRSVNYRPFKRLGLEEKRLDGQHHLNGYSGRYCDHIAKLSAVVSDISSHWKELFYEERIPHVYGDSAWERIRKEIDFNRIELVNRKDIADSVVTGIGRYFNKHKEKQTLTPDITRRTANACANLFIDIYKKDGRVRMELIDIISEIISLDDELTARSGTSAFFNKVIESLNDTFLLENRMVSIRVMVRAGWTLANSAKGRLIKEKLESFGIKSEEDMFERAKRGVAKRRFTGDKNKIKKALIFSRITKGADVLITSTAMARLRHIFPNAEVVLIGIPKDKQLFSEGSGIRIVELDYERRGSFISRLKSWAVAVDLIRRETSDLDEDEYIVVDCDTRIGQVGSLPCADPLENYYFLFSVMEESEIESGRIKNFAELVNEWIDDVFGGGDFEYPWVSFSKDDKDFAEAVKKNFNMDERHVISVSIGVGGAETKKPGEGFDLVLLKRLLEFPGTTIFLDKGTEEYNEPPYVIGLVSELRSEGRIIAEITYDEEKNMYLAQYNTLDGTVHILTGNSIRDIKLPPDIVPDIVTWQGTISGFGSLISVSDQYIGYDSLFGHAAAALGVPETIIFCGAVNDIFLHRWSPFSRSGLNIVKVSEDRRRDWDGIIDEVRRKIGVVPILEERNGAVPVFIERIAEKCGVERFVLDMRDFINVLMGIKKITEIVLDINEQQIKDIEYFLRVFKYTTGYSIKLCNLGNGNYCIYDENYLRYLIQKGVAEGIIAEELLYLCATQSGLEQEISRQMAGKEGLFYELSGKEMNSDDYRTKLKQRIPIDALVMPTYKRPTGLRRALELQTNNMRMFGHTHIPILVCSNTNPGETARFMSDEDVIEFQRFYNVDNPRDMKWGELDRIVIEDFRGKGFNVTYIDWDVRNRIIDDAVPVIAAKYKKSEDEVRRILEIILASNISGIRNFTILLGAGTRMISVDDDAIPRIRVPKREVLERILEERSKKARELEERFNEELRDGGDIKELIKRYYSYSEDGSTGLIPQALGQIVKERGTEDYWRFNDILRDTDNIYCGTLPPYLVTAEDVMMQDVDSPEYQYDEWDIDYMRILSETLGASPISPYAGRVFEHDKRGVVGNIAGQELLSRLLGKTIGIATTHFNHDQDWSGEALLDSFIERGAKVTDLQRATRKAIHLEVEGFSNTDAQFCFNTTSIDSTVYPVPTIGELYRTEEPYYTYSVRAVTGRIIAWSRTVGGHHRLDVSTRPNVPHQILNEEAAMAAWRLYDKAVRDTEQHFSNDYSNPAERMRYLGERFIEYGRNYELDDWVRDRMIRLQERIVRKIGDIVSRAQGEEEDVKKNLYAVAGELLIEFVIPQSNAVVADRDTIIYTRDGWPVKIIEKRIGEQRERVVEIIGDFDESIILHLDEDVRREFLKKVTDMIKTQVVNDGMTFLFWPDLTEAGSDELKELAEALSVLLGKDVRPQYIVIQDILYNEFAKRIEEFTGIRFTDRDRLIREDMRINRDEAERLIDGYLKQTALGLSKLNKPIGQITLDEFNKLFGVRHIVLAGGLGQRYSPRGIWHKALGIVGDDQTNIKLAVSGAYTSKGIRPVIVITTRIWQAITTDGHIDPVKKRELLPEDAILVWKKPEEAGGYGMDFMRGVSAAEELGILEDTAYVEIVFSEMATNQDKRVSNTSLCTYLKAVGEGYFITVAGRKDKVVENKGTFTYDEEGRLTALTDWKRLTDKEKKRGLDTLEKEGFAYVNANCGVYRREIIQYFDRFREDPMFKGIDPKTGKEEYIPWDLVSFISGEKPVGIMRLENAPASMKDIEGQNRFNEYWSGEDALMLRMDQSYRRGRVEIKSPDVRIGNGTYLKDAELSRNTYIGDGWAVVDSTVENVYLADHSLRDYSPPFKGRTNAKNTIENAVIRNTVIPEGRHIPKGARIEGIMPEEMQIAWALLGDEDLQIDNDISLSVALAVLEEMGYKLNRNIPVPEAARYVKSGFKSGFHPFYIWERLFNAIEDSIDVRFVFRLGDSARVFNLSLPGKTIGRQDDAVMYYLFTYIYNLLVSRGAEGIGVWTGDEEFTNRLIDILSCSFPLIEKKTNPGYSHIMPLLHKVYGKEVMFYKSDIDEINNIEKPNVGVIEEASLPLLNLLKQPKGVIAGVDAGGTDIKVVIYKDGRLVYAKEHIWNPKLFTESEQYIGMVERIIKEGLSECGLGEKGLSAIGISWPEIVIGDRMIPLSGKVKGLMGKEDELKRISGLRDEISRRFGNIPVAIANDGNIGAFWAGVELGKGNLIGLSMGTSCGVGYIDREGRITDFLTDMGSTVLNMSKDSTTAHNYSGIFGVAQKHLSQDGVFRLADEFGIDIPSGITGNAEKLRYIQSLLDSEDEIVKEKAEEVFKEIGRYLACFIEQIYLYFDESGTRNIAVFGRVINGKAGDMIISAARQNLRGDVNPAPCGAGIEGGALLIHSSPPQGVALSARCGVNIYLAPEITDNPDADRFGQAQGAVYLVYKRLLEERVYGLIHELDKKGVIEIESAEDDRGTILNAVLERIKKEYGLGIFAVVDAIRVVDNISVNRLARSADAGALPVSPYGMIIEEDRKNILLLDVDAFANKDLLYVVLLYGLIRSIMSIIPCESDEVRAVAVDYICLRLVEERGMKIDDAELKRLFQRFSFSEDWIEKIRDAENRYQAALKVLERTDEVIRGLGQSIKKIRMVVNSMPVIEIDFVNALVDAGKFIKLDADELMKPENRHIMDWLKKITEGKEKTPFVFYGSGAGELGLKSAQLPEDYKSEDVIDLWDLSKSQPRDRDNLYLPLVYSVSAIYLASEVVMAKGDITKIRDKLAKSTLESLYTVLFGGELSAEQWLRLFKGELWPPVEKITKTLNVLREAMAKIEAAA